MSEKKLTSEQEKQIDAYGLEMLKNGVKCDIKTDRKSASDAIHILYKKYLEIPKGPEEIVFVDSPEAAIAIVAKSQNKLPKELASEVRFMGLWTWWVAYYWAAINLLGETDGVEQDLIDDLNEYEKITKLMHAILPCEKICFVIEYPKVVSLLNDDLDSFKLHREEGLAVEYGDGTGFAWLHGVEVPDWIATTKAGKLSIQKLLAETNVDIRREGLRRVPVERLLKKTKAKLLDKEKDLKKGKHWDYALFDMDLGDSKKRIFLRMFDVASGGYPVERVDDNNKTVLQALAWRDDEDVYLPPVVRT